MAAPTTQQSGYSYVVYRGDPDSGGAIVTGGLDATLRQNVALTEATNKSSSRWSKSICGVRSWNVDTSGHYLVSSAEICVNGDSNPATFMVGSSSGVGGTAVKGITNITVECSADMFESVSSTTGLDAEVIPGNRTLMVTIEGEFYDFDLDITPTGGDEALEDLHDLIDGTATAAVECTVTWGAAQKLYASFRSESFELSHPHNGIITYSITLKATGSVTAPTTTSADTAIAGVLADFFNAAGVQSMVLYLSNDTADYLEWTGTAYLERISLSLPFSGESIAGYSATFRGSGALTKQGGDA
jgi:predicted secreted protein